MKIGTITTAAGILALGLASSVTPGRAQSPIFDRVEANIPYSFSVADKTLPPGQYVIQQTRDMGGSNRALQFFASDGTRFETTCVTIPTQNINTPDRTQVVLHHYGADYYFDKVWIQGKDYGYECPLPSAVKNREKERMEPVTIAATYSTTTEQPQTTPPPPPQTTEAAPPPPPPAPEAPAPPPPMPKTNAGWLMMLLGGGALSGIGLSLRRFKK